MDRFRVSVSRIFRTVKRDTEDVSEKDESPTVPASSPPTVERGMMDTSSVIQDEASSTPSSIYDTEDPPEMAALTHPVDWRRQISVIIGPPVILICDLVIPCVVYYVWLRFNVEEPLYNDKILGAAVACFGFGELYILIVRVARLIRHREECAPLLSEHWWELDATSWVYGTALICGLIPFVVATSVGPEMQRKVVPQLYLYSPGVYVTYLLLWCLLTLLPLNLPVRINSDPKGTRVRPLAYYAAEDFLAVDGWQGRDFRRRYGERYDASPMFRRMLLELTLWWIGGCVFYLGALSAIIWNLEFHTGFGLSLGLLFGWIILWAICTYLYVQIALGREREWWLRRAERAVIV